MKQYKNFISLGYFCSVALELEKIGLRSTSSPFDWVISNYEGVINAMQNHFEDFLSYDHLLQSESIRKRYFDEKYRMWFFHDFDQYHSLKAQLPDVKAKYLRRIDRFYEDIKQPTLFVRYISDETEEEVEYIKKNHTKIKELLKSFNEANEVLYIANSGGKKLQELDYIKVFRVDRDDQDVVARHFLDKNEELRQLFEMFEYSLRHQNLEFYNSKQKKKRNIFFKIKRVISVGSKKVLPEYKHDRVVSDNVK